MGNTDVVYSNALQTKAENGDPEAQLQLAEAYIFGNGITENAEQAEIWALKAAEQDYAAAMFFLAEGYETEAMTCSDENKAAAKLCYQKAAHWFQKAVDQQHVEAMLSLSDLYEDGEGVARDLSKAFQLREQAAQLGLAIAMNKLRYCYEKGIGVEADLGKAAYWEDMFQQHKEKSPPTDQIVELIRDWEAIQKRRQ
ncbi:Sel1 repeat-containing protein [Acinetobacter calcoaceticus]|uniref:Sel1 repeat-containing protein n=1 Tax=Acinetobacter calcoaceticus TaxID=471 RepID=A0A4R1XIM5_ACICA|nr:Sel1 repeat-containing protein [Acinetobacter calcoaceticus]